MPDEFDAPIEEPIIDVVPDEEEGTGRSGLRTAALISGRMLGGIVAIGIAAATIGATALLPLPSVRTGPPSVLVTPAPTAQQVVCPGGLVRLSDASGKGATTASTLGEASLSSAATLGAVIQKPFDDSDAGTGGSAAAPQLLSTQAASAGARSAAFIAGAQAQSINTNEFFGLAAASCSPTTTDVWLTGGSTVVGRTTLLSLANPTDVSATVSLQLFGENGPVTAPGMSGIVVTAHSQRILSLAGFAPGLASPVVHVVSRGGQIVASLEQTTVRGLEPGGVDFVGYQTGPARSTMLPGVVLVNSAAVQARLGESGFDDLATVLRIYLPGNAAAKATINVIPEGATQKTTAFSVNVQPGHVNDFPLDSLSDGSYSIRVDSTQPAVTAIRVSTAGSPAVANRTDFAWITPAPLLSGDSLVTAPLGVAGQLNLVNPSSAPATVTLTPIGGAPVPVALRAESATQLTIAAGTTYRISGAKALYGSVTAQVDGGIASFVVRPPEPASSPIRIYP